VETSAALVPRDPRTMTMPRTDKRLMFHPDDEESGAPKQSRVTAPPGRRGSRDDAQAKGQGRDETNEESAGCIYVRGDGPEMAAEVQYHIRAQTGTTAGAGKRIKGLGTTFGLPIDEPQHGEVHAVETEDIEGHDTHVPARKKLQATE
jgi:hypothetical protein